MSIDRVVFDPEKVRKFTEIDSLLKFVFNDLKERGHEEDFALELIFNSFVLNDSVMEKAYMNI